MPQPTSRLLHYLTRPNPHLRRREAAKHPHGEPLRTFRPNDQMKGSFVEGSVRTKHPLFEESAVVSAAHKELLKQLAPKPSLGEIMFRGIKRFVNSAACFVSLLTACPKQKK